MNEFPRRFTSIELDIFSADGDFIITLLTKAKVHHTGRLVWEPPAIYKSYCPIDVEFFPFDMQECFMKFSSWTYDGLQVDLQHFCSLNDNKTKSILPSNDEIVITQGIDLTGYYQNVEWDIINVTARRNVKFYQCCPEPYPDITFNVTIRRRTLFYSVNLMVPCMSISCMCVLVFYLPSDSGEKITLSISILLALTVFFLLLSDLIPPTSFVIPLIGKYLLFTMIVVTMSIILTIFVLSIHYRSPSTHKMSPWVRRVFTELLPRILLMKRPEVERKKRVAIRTCNGIELRDNVPGGSGRSWEQFQSGQRSVPEEGDLDSSSAQLLRSRQPAEVTASLQGVRFIADQMKEEDAFEDEIRDWKYVAMVMDRFFLFIFTTACFTGTMSIFLHAPSLYDPRMPLTSNEPNQTCIY
ncbi:acetylcholine receptor subunit alpha-like 1 isoform X2 [Liolophura sinensis]|uniref:acetylcholine receptor subunit alpha-like 1 isoform X2 n=1 Tax=Liolophura sinensis TaxID=3198878 RepID=UPI0031593D2B